MKQFQKLVHLLWVSVGDIRQNVGAFSTWQSEPRIADLNRMSSIVFEIEQALADAKAIRDAIEEAIDSKNAAKK